MVTHFDFHRDLVQLQGTASSPSSTEDYHFSGTFHASVVGENASEVSAIAMAPSIDPADRSEPPDISTYEKMSSILSHVSAFLLTNMGSGLESQANLPEGASDRVPFGPHENLSELDWTDGRTQPPSSTNCVAKNQPNDASSTPQMPLKRKSSKRKRIPISPLLRHCYVPIDKHIAEALRTEDILSAVPFPSEAIRLLYESECTWTSPPTIQSSSQAAAYMACGAPAPMMDAFCHQDDITYSMETEFHQTKYEMTDPAVVRLKTEVESMTDETFNEILAYLDELQTPQVFFVDREDTFSPYVSGDESFGDSEYDTDYLDILYKTYSEKFNNKCPVNVAADEKQYASSHETPLNLNENYCDGMETEINEHPDELSSLSQSNINENVEDQSPPGIMYDNPQLYAMDDLQYTVQTQCIEVTDCEESDHDLLTAFSGINVTELVDGEVKDVYDTIVDLGLSDAENIGLFEDDLSEDVGYPDEPRTWHTPAETPEEKQAFMKKVKNVVLDHCYCLTSDTIDAEIQRTSDSPIGLPEIPVIVKVEQDLEAVHDKLLKKDSPKNIPVEKYSDLIDRQCLQTDREDRKSTKDACKGKKRTKKYKLLKDEGASDEPVLKKLKIICTSPAADDKSDTESDDDIDVVSIEEDGSFMKESDFLMRCNEQTVKRTGIKTRGGRQPGAGKPFVSNKVESSEYSSSSDSDDDDDPDFAQSPSNKQVQRMRYQRTSGRGRGGRSRRCDRMADGYLSDNGSMIKRNRRRGRHKGGKHQDIRHHHNESERMRRIALTKQTIDLQNLIVGLDPSRRHSRQVVLKSAADYIKKLERESKELLRRKSELESDLKQNTRKLQKLAKNKGRC